MNPLTQWIGSRETKRANFLSVGVTLCSIVAAICVAPLAFVHTWIAIWLLVLATILILGTFGIFAFYAIYRPGILSTESHVEKMAAISILGTNRESEPAVLQAIAGLPVVDNPRLSSQGQTT